ncbi:MAG: glycoside hydrolase family 3 C-terminal domain-containing protein [Verrucomicrobiota bacterium]
MPKLRPSLFALLASAALVVPARATTNSFVYPFLNPDLPVEERISNAVSLMNTDEKVAFLRFRAGVPRLGIPPLGSVEGLHGLAMGGPSNWGKRNPAPTTIFPQAIGLAETWNPALLKRVAAAEAYEVRYMAQSPKYHRGGLVVFAPNADLGRDPRWGRTEECYGEDPWFNGTLVTAFVQGLQGDDPRYWMTASLLKHFFANSNEDGRDSSSSNFDEQLFREYYSVPFRMGFELGGARCFMAAYNAWNGVPCTLQPVLRNVAMKEWGVDGVISTDGGGLRNLVTSHHAFTTTNAAAAACIKAGINIFLDDYRASITNALADGLLTVPEIDEVIRGTLRISIRVGLLDPPDRVPYASIGATNEPEPWLSEKTKSLVREATRESIVLLKNSDRCLPLDRARLKSIALIGPRANAVLADWYSGNPAYTVTPFDGIRAAAGPGIRVSLATNNDGGIAERLAHESDIAILCVGNHPVGGDDSKWAEVSDPGEGREARDRQSLTLGQEELVRRVFAANPRTIVVLISSFPYAIGWIQDHVPAVLHLTQSSEELGSALADALFGDYNPAGRLVQTWPASIDQLPPMMDYDIRHGRTYQYLQGRPLYPFGYGLSYTTFDYSKLSAETKKDGTFAASFSVRNSGKVAGDEVAQLYVKFPKSAVPRPIRQLRGFQRVHLQPGESRTVEFTIRPADLAYWDPARHAFAVEPGPVEIEAGASSADIRLTKRVEVRY